MPLYDYKCTSCGTVTERINSHAITAIDCPKCGADAIRQVAAHAKTAAAWEVGRGGCSLPAGSTHE